MMHYDLFVIMFKIQNALLIFCQNANISTIPIMICNYILLMWIKNWIHKTNIYLYDYLTSLYPILLLGGSSDVKSLARTDMVTAVSPRTVTIYIILYIFVYMCKDYILISKSKKILLYFL